MQLLGKYKSTLTSFHYQELISLLKDAIKAGEYSGNKTFDKAAIASLQTAAQDFSSLPLPSSGSKATDDSFNRPIDLLKARFQALAAESSDFGSRTRKLISVLEKDSLLLDQLLAAATLAAWDKLQPQLRSSVSLDWDFAMGYGSVDNSSATGVVTQDPSTGVTYTTRPPLGSILNLSNGAYHAGLLPSRNRSTASPVGLVWSFSTTGQSETNYGTNWGTLSILEDFPRVNFSSSPGVEVITPIGGSVSDILSFSGSVRGGSLPIYVNIQFSPRRLQSSISPVNVAPLLSTKFKVAPGTQTYIRVQYHNSAGTDGNYRASLIYFDSSGVQVQDALGNNVKTSLPTQPPVVSGLGVISGTVSIPSFPAIATAQLVTEGVGTTTGTWINDTFVVHTPQVIGGRQINQDSVAAYSGSTIYFAGEDFSVGADSTILFWNIPDGSPLTIRCTEMFPSYQCSVDSHNWSPLFMLDVNRPYPDDEKVFFPLSISNGQFPLTDELGVPTGLYMTVKQRPSSEYLLRITTPSVGTQPGVQALLEVDFGSVSYMTGLSISPVTNFPMRLINIEGQAFTGNTRANLYSGGFVVDRPVTITFQRQLIGKLFLTFSQENYSLKEHKVDPPDKLRRDTLSNIQSSLPFSVRRVIPSSVTTFRGAQYDFGVEQISGEDWKFVVPDVYVSGPYRFSGCPEVIRFDASKVGSPQFYLCFRAFNASGSEVDVQLQGVSITSGNCIVFPFVNSLDRTTVSYVDIFLKIAFRNSSDLVERFSMQVSNSV